jgi:TRAP-type C4-dicarboxylate transport system permease small subunit
MWSGLAVPVGWTLGVLVTLANLVRPTDEDEE